MVLIYNLHLFRIYGSDRYDIKKKNTVVWKSSQVKDVCLYNVHVCVKDICL
jgi:hypothetical protein